MIRSRFAPVCIGLLLAGPVPSGRAGAEDRVDFARDIRPILARNATSATGRRSRSRACGSTARPMPSPGGDSGPVIEPGKTAESLLIARMSGRRPGDDHAAQGTSAVAEAGRRAAGLDRPGGSTGPTGADRHGRRPADHWAFRPRSAADAPRGPATATGCATRSTRFILARLETEGSRPRPRPTAPTLIRRLSLDLLGLPPTPAEVDAFVDDTPARRLRAAGRSPARLAALRRALGPALARPGPLRRQRRLREGRARARTPGATATGSSTRSTATCRSTSSRSSNSPATCCPSATLEQKVATGFHRNTLINQEGGVDQEQFRVEAVVDRVNTTGTVWLGLTVGCAQCHDHKYDPITQREYYRLFAFFNTGQEVDLPARRCRSEVRAYEQAKAKHDAEHAQLERPSADYDRTSVPPARRSGSGTVGGRRGGPLDRARPDRDDRRPPARRSAGCRTARSWSAGRSPTADTYTIVAEPTSSRSPRSGSRCSTTEPAGEGTRPSGNGNFVLSEFASRQAPSSASGRAVAGRLAGPPADFSQDSAMSPGRSTATRRPAGRSPAVRQAPRRRLRDAGRRPGGGTGSTIALDSSTAAGTRSAGFGSRSPTQAARQADGLPDDVAEILAAPEGRTDAQRARLAAYHRDDRSRVDAAQRGPGRPAKKAPTPPAARAMTLAENPNRPRRTS